MTPRSVALALGAALALLTGAELVVGEWSPGGLTVIDRTTKGNLLHWVGALALLGSFFAGVSASRAACRVTGFLFAALTIWGLLSAVSLGGALGYSDGIPHSYQVIHGVAALVALTSGFRPSEGA